MGTIGTVLTPQMPKQVWQSEDGHVFQSEEECKTYEIIAPLLRRLYDSEWEQRVEKGLGLQEGFAYCLKSGFSVGMALKYRESFGRFADFLQGRVNFE